MFKSRTSTSSTGTNSIKSLGNSLPTEEAKTPEKERGQPINRHKLTPKKEQTESKAQGSPLSARAQKIKDSLKQKSLVKAVLLKADGSAEEIDYDTSSKQANQLVNGRPTIVGELEDLNAVIVRSLSQTADKDLNQHQLPVPFCNKQYYGNYLLYRVDAAGNAVDLSLKQYAQFVEANKKLTENARKNYNPIDNQEIHSQSSFNSNSRLTLVYLKSEVDKKVRADFKQKNGRNANDKEIEDLVNESLDKLVNELALSSSKLTDPDYDPKDDDADYDMIKSLKQIYLEENGVVLGDNELAGTLSNTRRILDNDEGGEMIDDRDWRLQLNDALNYVRERGRLDGRMLAEKISETFYELNGKEPSLNELVEVFRRIRCELAEEAEEDMKETEQALSLPAAMCMRDAEPSEIVDMAFRVVSQDLVNRAKSSFIICKGREPTETELKDGVDTLALKMAQKAVDEFLAKQAASPSNNDPDYDPTNDIDIRLARKDAQEDKLWKSENFNLKMLKSRETHSRSGNATAYNVYFSQTHPKRDAINLRKAIRSFKMRNKREPSNTEMQRLKQFMTVDRDTSLIEFQLSVISDGDMESKADNAIQRRRAKVMTTPTKVLVTPVNKKKTAARYNVYFEENKSKLDQTRNERMAIKWFKRFNNREPNKLELAGIKQFTNSDKAELTEVEYEVPVDRDDEKETEFDDEVQTKVKSDSVVEKKSSTKYTLNFDDDSARENGDERQALRWFKRFNNRQPTKAEQHKIQQFVRSDRAQPADTID
eukprot:CAMPEP_0197027222 /NCGR_PEP_ID=MMETSP1384-20130603/7176_1 /TAXON_ID=29189 /ORGANISM="Ammonia sp." /LENGTH=766 /DNA_ID=CAMNT_0042456035 /DNA_START=115 /DNA_END=2412 /DNA_ORIENTATION=+